MKRPKKENFDYGDHITDWLYWEQKYTKALNNYIDKLEKQLTIHDVVGRSEQLCVNCNKAKVEKGDICDNCVEMYKNF